MISWLRESESRRLNATKSEIVPRPPSSRVPLSFQQLVWWNALEVFWPVMNARYFAVVLRLRGRLDVEALRRSVAHVVRRHESLRTRIIVVDGVPIQEIDAVPEQTLEMLDVRAAGASVESEAKRLVETLVNEPVAADIGPLFGVRLLKLADLEYVFALALNHAITDHVSEHVLLRDIWTLYVQLLRVRPLSLPCMPVQYGDYAIWQRRTHKSWLAKHGNYWQRRLENAPPTCFLVEEDLRPAARIRGAKTQISLGQTITEGLRQLSKRYRTTLVMLTGFVALALRWRQRRDVVVGCVVSRNAIFNWLSRLDGLDSSLLELQGSKDALSLEPFEYGVFDVELENRTGILSADPHLMLSDPPEGISGLFHYRADLFGAETMEKLGRNFRLVIEQMLDDPNRIVESVEYEH